MTKHISNSIIWDDKWQMIQVKQHEFSKLWLFFAMVDKNWYYGEGETITLAMMNCEIKIGFGIKAGKANIKEKLNLEDLF